MAVERHPLLKWKYPSPKVLRNEVFASDKPPFAPFPTVTNLINANLCPYALYHDLIHGIQNALIGHYRFNKRGELFNRFIAHLKLSIKNGEELKGDIPAQQQVIQNWFHRFAQSQNFKSKERSDIWRSYIEPWVTYKLKNGELQGISKDDQLFFEVSVANYYTPFPLKDGIRNYPLRGRIDEIDLTHKRIIERTIKGKSDEEHPPFLKDYQIWLLWKILCSLKREQLPLPWRDLNFEDFECIVETPHRDFIISDNPEYILHTHWAYAWINDISISESPEVFKVVIENRQCAPENPHPHCEHRFVNCFKTDFFYPSSRPEIRKAFQPWYRGLLWEQMWNGHLWHYQILRLEQKDLVNYGLAIETKVVSHKDNQIELELIERKVNTLRGYEYCTIIPYGTVFCGVNMNAKLIKTMDNKIFLQIDGVLPAISKEVLLLLSPDISIPVMKESPKFLERYEQSNLFNLKYIGTNEIEESQKRSVIQLLEAIFGTRQLRREIDERRTESENK
jgi:hypothetical protein